MGIKIASHLHRNRHGIYYFRQAVPPDLRRAFSVKEVYVSLRTGFRGEAIHRVMAIASTFRSVFVTLRRMGDEKDTNGAQGFDWDAFQTKLAEADAESRRRLTEEATQLSKLPAPMAHAIEEAKRRAHLREQIDAAQKSADQTAHQLQRERENHREQIELLLRSKSTQEKQLDSPIVSEVFERFCLAKAPKWTYPESTRKYDYGPHVSHFIDVIGDKQIAQITAEDVRKYKDAVLRASDAVGNKKKLFNRIKALLNWARGELLMSSDFRSILKVETKTTAHESYEPFTDDELRALFESDDYRHHRFKQAGQFWMPLLGLFTGARINELAQLHLTDVKVIDAVHVIDINDEELKKLKGSASVRTVPLHPKLIELGFLGYVDLLRSEGRRRVFPEYTRSRAKDGYGKNASRQFTDYRRKHGVHRGETRVSDDGWTGDSKVVFHSFRHSANSALRRAGVPLERRERLVGHSSEAINQKYAPADRALIFPIAMLYGDIKTLAFPVNFTSYKPTLRQKREREKAVARAIALKRDAG
jgi:integrase